MNNLGENEGPDTAMSSPSENLFETYCHCTTGYKKVKMTIHRSGLREIHVDNQLLILTSDEYQRATRRGDSVLRNRGEGRKRHGF